MIFFQKKLNDRSNKVMQNAKNETNNAIGQLREATPIHVQRLQKLQ